MNRQFLPLQRGAHFPSVEFQDALYNGQPQPGTFGIAPGLISPVKALKHLIRLQAGGIRYPVGDADMETAPILRHNRYGGGGVSPSASIRILFLYKICREAFLKGSGQSPVDQNNCQNRSPDNDAVNQNITRNLPVNDLPVLQAA